MKSFVFIVLAVLCLTAAPAWAGPPLICHAAAIGNAPSLPWVATGGWDGADLSYDVSHLTGDTLALLTPQTPVEVRTETLRRAAIYAAEREGLAGTLEQRLLERARAADAASRPDPTAWFDAGYFAETVHEAALLYQRNMLRPDQRAGWQLREDTHLDGLSMIRKAIGMGGVGMAEAESAVAFGRRSF